MRSLVTPAPSHVSITSWEEIREVTVVGDAQLCFVCSGFSVLCIVMNFLSELLASLGESLS